MSSVATCKLNAKFEEALANPRVYKSKGIIDGWGNYATGIRDKKYKDVMIQVYIRGMGCCGMEELDFQKLQPRWGVYKDDPEGFEAVVAHYVARTRAEGDESVLVVGIPTKVGDGSLYDVEFYNALRAVLEKFGFVTLCKPYRNKNSGNIIVALAGQMP